MIDTWFKADLFLACPHGRRPFGQFTLGTASMKTGLVTLVGLDLASSFEVRRYKINF